MFLVHGIRRKEMGRHALPGDCSICEESNCVQLVVVQPYVHFFWLPLFPLPKRGKTVCLNCGHEVAHGKLDIGIKLLFNDLRKHERTPIWMFAGVALLAVILPMFVLSMMRYNEEETALLEVPKVGDVWTIKLGYKHYTLYRVEEVLTDSVYVRMNANEVKDAGVLALAKFQIGNADGFTGDRIGYARKELPGMNDHGPIHSVSRATKADSLR